VDRRSREDAEPFTTADGSTIRVLLDAEIAAARNQSLAEATLDPGQATERHYHRETEEIYVILAGSGEMEVDGERERVGAGDAVLIAPRAWHQIRADGGEELRFLCCCAPPYRHEDTFFQ
jgi:mannose-6-phosphate isomerase-like protein (cupin superfamily)